MNKSVGFVGTSPKHQKLLQNEVKKYNQMKNYNQTIGNDCFNAPNSSPL